MSERVWSIAEAAGHWLLAWTLVVLVVAVYMRLAKPRRSTIRYGGWLLATFAGVVLLPVIAIGPRLSWSEILSAFRSSANAPIEFQSWFQNSRRVLEPTPVVVQNHSVDPISPLAPSVGSAASGDVRSIEPRVGFFGGDRLLAVVIACWALGFAAFMARLAYSTVRISRMLANVIPEIPERLGEDLQHTSRELGVRRSVRIATHPEIVAPMCVGLLRPIILWPTDANCPMTARQRQASLTHEVGHLRRGDDWIALLAELWRAVSWFYPPVHYTVACLSREREYVCDDLAAGKMDTPERYAQWLLDLAPVGVAPPVLSASFLGGAGLVGRVRRIVDGELKWARPVSRKHAVILGLAAVVTLGGAGSIRLVGFLNHASAQQADGRLPEITIQELAKKMRESWQRYDKGYLEVKFVETRDMNWHFNKKDAKPEEQAPVIVEFPGRAQFASDGKRWKVEYDSSLPRLMTGELSPDRWSTGFDGQQRYGWQIDRDLVTLGESGGMEDQWKPASRFWVDGEALHESFARENPRMLPFVIRQTVIDGAPCYLVEGVSKSDPEWRSEYVISPRHGFLPIRISSSRNKKKYSIKEMHELKEAAPGLWFPGRIETESLNPRMDGEVRMNNHRTIRVVTYDPQRKFNADSFVLPIPDDMDVTDRRLGYSYHTDPWWTEVGPMLRERFNWPEADLSLLNNLSTYAPATIEGKPAPEIQAEKWIDTDPVDLAKLRGKVVLLLFWSNRWTSSPEMLAPLQRIGAIYKSAGLEIVTVHSPTDEIDELRRFMKEYKITWPVAVDMKNSERTGVTQKAYGVEGQPCAILVDREGNLHSIGQGGFKSGQLVKKLVPLLNAVEGIDAKAVELVEPDLSNEMSKEMGKFFTDKAREALEADPAGQISGRILDGDGQPISGVRVSAALNFVMLMHASPMGYLWTPFRAKMPRFTTVTDADGRYTLSRLCKGIYVVKAQVQGRAWQDQRVTISAEMKSATVDFRLDQNDTISGVVRDELGQPIVGAKVRATHRQHFVDGQLKHTTSLNNDAVVTNPQGRFIISDLQAGRYIFQITAPGHIDAELEGVPAGTVNSTVVMRRLVKP